MTFSSFNSSVNLKSKVNGTKSKSKTSTPRQPRKKVAKIVDDEDDDEDYQNDNEKHEFKSEDDSSTDNLKKKKIKDEDEYEYEETPKKKTQAKAKSKKKDLENGKPKSKSKSKVKKESDDKKTLTKLQKEEAKRIKEEEKKKKLEEKEKNTYKWWENEEEGDKDGEIKWQTLEHNGVMFPPEYEPLPSNVKLYYDGKPVDLPPKVEEVAGFFAALIETEYGKNPIFQKNFFRDFKDLIKKHNSKNPDDKISIESFDKCDFTKIFNYFEAEKERKKALPNSVKKQQRDEKNKLAEPFKFCFVDGRKEQVGNFTIEPPGLFRGRGSHPKTGTLKKRVFPEEITINIGKEAKVPEPPTGHKWAEVRNDNTVTWLATWKENVLGQNKYVRFAANSSFKGMSDLKKYNKCRELKNHIEKIRLDYNKNLKSKVMQERQIAVAIYFIDKLALRAGGEKNTEDLADTVGCCSLRYEHVTLEPPNYVIFDFLGKDSVPYHQKVEVDAQVFKNIRIFKRPPKKSGDKLFDRIDPTILNNFLQNNYMKGLTAKVIRTYNASNTMQEQLDLMEKKGNFKGSIEEKIVAFRAANKEVAILCNHQKGITKNFDETLQKFHDKIEEMKWQKMRTSKMLNQIDEKFKAKKLGFTKNKIKVIHKRIIDREKEKIIKKFDKENESLKFENKKLLPKSELKERLTKIVELESFYKEEYETGKVSVGLSSNVTVLQNQLKKFDTRIKNAALQLQDKEDNKNVALNTSIMNYIDPRLCVMFCKRYKVPIEKIFSKTIRDRFTWAIHNADENWRF
ncbi:DNA topoisomerase 1 ASCRUDRAFT_32944 [Ascoidea rubescens DSM 1968]|uniref:DNA topoisomerase I n=1 Tax=Ascoidea rubescens DSM 1968 TaxID=1344418 RepID=A0A1D2VLR4_9ASCO|nr:hypothetical protein ASCRUDRAFT_32944 [Ascoidea rubescens DSM 1968]ODV62487.1 hypothetical protein ASCRUDRAFT_32944 [Ascoidea rubescens DSM 1968]